MNGFNQITPQKPAPQGPWASGSQEACYWCIRNQIDAAGLALSMQRMLMDPQQGPPAIPQSCESLYKCIEHGLDLARQNPLGHSDLCVQCSWQPASDKLGCTQCTTLNGGKPTITVACNYQNWNDYTLLHELIHWCLGCGKGGMKNSTIPPGVSWEEWDKYSECRWISCVQSCFSYNAALGPGGKLPITHSCSCGYGYNVDCIEGDVKCSGVD